MDLKRGRCEISPAKGSFEACLAVQHAPTPPQHTLQVAAQHGPGCRGHGGCGSGAPTQYSYSASTGIRGTPPICFEPLHIERGAPLQRVRAHERSSSLRDGERCGDDEAHLRSGQRHQWRHNEHAGQARSVAPDPRQLRALPRRRRVRRHHAGADRRPDPTKPHPEACLNLPHRTSPPNTAQVFPTILLELFSGESSRARTHTHRPRAPHVTHT